MADVLPNINKLMYHGWKLETKITGFPPYPVCLIEKWNNDLWQKVDSPIMGNLLLKIANIKILFKHNGINQIADFSGTILSPGATYRSTYYRITDEKFELQIYGNGSDNSVRVQFDDHPEGQPDQGSPIYVIGGGN